MFEIFVHANEPSSSFAGSIHIHAPGNMQSVLTLTAEKIGSGLSVSSVMQ